jgi:tartrate-resistant acid phosphatase type 5
LFLAVLSVAPAAWGLAGCGSSSTATGDEPTPTGGSTEATTAGATTAGATTPSTADAALPGTGSGTTGGTSGGSTPDAGSDAGTAPRALHFIAIGDVGKGDAGQWAVAGAMTETCQRRGCDFVLFLGDNLYPSGAGSPTDPIFDEKFERPYGTMNFPFHIVLGNHDYGGNGAGNEFARPDNEVAYTQRSTRWSLPARYYRFTEGPADFFAFDTNSAMYSRDADQKKDMKAWIAASTAKWKIGFGHHPYLSNGTHGNAGNYDGLSWVPVFSGKGVKTFAEEVYCGKLDIYFSGHDHSQQWLEDTCQGTALVVSGAGAEGTAIVQNRNAYHYQTSDLGFLYVTLEEHTLRTEFVDAQGNTQFERSLTK